MLNLIQKIMKKSIMFLLVALYVLPMFSQPTKKDYLPQGNKTSLPCPCDTQKVVASKKVVVINKAVVAKKQYHHAKQPTYINTSLLKKPVSFFRKDTIVINNYINVTNNNDAMVTAINKFTDKENDAFLKRNKEREDIYANRMNMILIPHIYRSKGTLKIISGLTLQAFAVGMVAYADIDHYSVNNVTTTQQVPYTYQEYHIVVTPVTVNSSSSKCYPVPVPPTNTNDNNNSNNNTSGSNSNSNSNSNSSSNSTATAPTDVNNTNNNNVNVTTPVTVTVNVAPPVINNNINITVPTYTLTSTTKTGYITITQTNQEVTVRHQNKTPYYIVAGALGLIGTGLEISGIIDFHHANVYISQNAIGVAIKF